MSYVVVEDVFASWEHYQRVADALAKSTPVGLYVHAAGRTDEGFRIVGVWESEAAWRRFADHVGAGPAVQAIRSLRPDHLVFGERKELQ